MKKKMTVLVGLMVLITAIAFADDRTFLNDALEGAEVASPLNWQEDKLVWKTGSIDLMSAENVVIDDVGYQWSKNGTRFLDIDGSILTSSNFEPGTEVTIVLEGDRKTIKTLIKGSIAEE